MDKQEAKKMKSALGVLKATLIWACRERSKSLGEPAICLRGNQLSYSSLEGTTVGVNLPGPRVDREPVYVRASLVKAALAAMPGEMHIDYANCTINGLSYTKQGTQRKLPCRRCEPDLRTGKDTGCHSDAGSPE